MHYKHLPSPVNFREDINGLRAWAVMAVLLFHFSLFGLEGGFVGVDVFFVISGYLMTQIIIGGHEKGGFSIIQFYMARVRRILPALIALSAFLLLIGWFFLPTSDYQSLSKQIVVSLSFFANYYFMLLSGDYFAVQDSEIWMLHTWSLAVEAQFYVLFPLLVAFIWRIKPSRNAVLLIISVLCVISFLFAVYINKQDSQFSFYGLPTRAWELLFGGIVYLVSSRLTIANPIKSTFYGLGWIMLITSLFFIQKSTPWPGIHTLLPVIGTGFIILAAKQNVFFTDNFIAQWLGDRSYSIYLWHWPVVVALSFTMTQHLWMWVILGMFVSLSMGALSYQLVETPTRKYLSKFKLKKEVFFIGISVTVIVLVSLLIKLNTFPGRINPQAETAANEALNFGQQRMECLTGLYGSEEYQPGCKIGQSSDVGAILIGDSHSASLMSALASAASEHGKSIYYRGMNDCSSIINVDRFSKDGNADRRREACAKFNLDTERFLQQFDTSIPLIIANRFNLVIHNGLESDRSQKESETVNRVDYNLNQLVNTLCLYQNKRQVYVVNSTPEFAFSVPKKLSRTLLYNHNAQDIKIPLQEYVSKNQLIWKAQKRAEKQCGVKILDTTPYLCDNEYCYGSKDKRPLYFDGNHLSEYGNRFLIPMFNEHLFK